MSPDSLKMLDNVSMANRPDDEIFSLLIESRKKSPQDSNTFNIETQISKLFVKYPLLNGVSVNLASVLSRAVCSILRGDFPQALEQFIADSQGMEIADNDAESYVLLGRNLSALTNNTGTYVYFKKMWVSYLLDCLRGEEARQELDELEPLLPDDEELTALKERLASLAEEKILNEKTPIVVDVHGSCVSRTIFNQDMSGETKVGQNFSRNNIVSCMMPPVELSIPRSELHYRSDYAYRCVEYALNKETIPRLYASKADFLVIDFFDFCQHVAAAGHTTFSTYDYTVLAAPSVKVSSWGKQQLNFLEIPTFLWYGYVDLYWKSMADKFQNNIVLSRLNCCEQYITKKRAAAPLPARVLSFGNAKYNAALAELELYVIKKYDPYVIDVSKYFVADENYEADVTPVHYEENYAKSAWRIMRHILLNRPKQKIFDCLPPLITAELLARDLPDNEFMKIWQKRTKPFASCSFLDDFCLRMNANDFLHNRLWLASLYRFFDGIDLDTPVEKYTEKVSDFIDWLGKHEASNIFQRKAIETLREKYKVGFVP